MWLITDDRLWTGCGHDQSQLWTSGSIVRRLVTAGNKLVTSGSLERRTPTRGIRSGGRARMWTGGDKLVTAVRNDDK